MRHAGRIRPGRCPRPRQGASRPLDPAETTLRVVENISALPSSVPQKAPLCKGSWPEGAEGLYSKPFQKEKTMQRKHNHNLVSAAKALRRNMTKEERHLWYDFLRQHPLKFVRQKVLGKYIADFYCAEAKLVVELDGSQHYEEAGLASDAERTAFLAEYGIAVLRIANIDVMRNFEAVCNYIDMEINRLLG